MTSSRSPVIVILTIVACVAAAPSQIRVGNPRFNAEVYSRPEFAEALARNYEALEWQAKNLEDNMRIAERRTLDPLGGGNLLRALYDRNLDQLGGASLLRQLSENAIDDENQKSQESGSSNLWANSVATRNAFTDENDLQTNIDRNTIDDLLNNMQFDKYDKTRRSRSVSRKPVVLPVIKTRIDGRHFTDDSDSQTNIHHIAGDVLKDQQFNKFDKTRSERSVQRFDDGRIRMNKGGEPELRNIENIIGGNLRQIQRKSLDSLSGATFGHSKKSSFNTVNDANHNIPYWRYDYPDFPKRNFDEIDRSNLDTFVKRDLNSGNRKFLIETKNFDEIDRTGFGDFREPRIVADNGRSGKR